MKNTILTLLMVSLFVSGFGQLITLNQTAVVYNAYLQLVMGFVLLLWLSHKAISYGENRRSITNNRDKAVHKVSKKVLA